MLDLKYSLIIEATEDPNYFRFYSPGLDGFTGIGHSLEDCLYEAKWGIEEHLELLKKEVLTVPEPNFNPTIIIQNSPVQETINT